jgi:hypothetical protein
MNKREVIIELGVEGGSIGVYGVRTEQGWLFSQNAETAEVNMLVHRYFYLIVITSFALTFSAKAFVVPSRTLVANPNVKLQLIRMRPKLFASFSSPISP